MMNDPRLHPSRVFLLLGLFFSSAHAGELDGLIIDGTMTQIIGTFDTYGQVKVGDAFELNLTDLPKDKIVFTRAGFDPKKDSTPYIPISAPLVLGKVRDPRDTGGGGIIGGSIHVSSIDPVSDTKLLVQIHTNEIKKGGKATIYIYQQVSGEISGMAEAEAVFK